MIHLTFSTFSIQKPLGDDSGKYATFHRRVHRRINVAYIQTKVFHLSLLPQYTLLMEGSPSALTADRIKVIWGFFVLNARDNNYVLWLHLHSFVIVPLRHLFTEAWRNWLCVVSAAGACGGLEQKVSRSKYVRNSYRWYSLTWGSYILNKSNLIFRKWNIGIHLHHLQLKEYKARFGDCMVPQRYQANMQLGTW